MGPRESDHASMLKVIQSGKYKTVEELVAATVPDRIKLKKPLELKEDVMSETEALDAITSMAKKVRTRGGG